MSGKWIISDLVGQQSGGQEISMDMERDCYLQKDTGMNDIFVQVNEEFDKEEIKQARKLVTVEN